MGMLVLCHNIDEHPDKYPNGIGKEYYDVVEDGEDIPLCRGCGQRMFAYVGKDK